MISNQNDVLRALQNWNQSLRLSGLCCLVNEHLLELVTLQPLIKRRDTSCADDVGVSQDLILGLALQVFVNLLVTLVKLAINLALRQHILPLAERSMLQMLDLLMQRDVVDAGVDGLARSSAEAHNLKTRSIDLLGQLVDSNVRWSAHEHFPQLLAHQMRNQSSRRDGLSSARWPLNQSQRRRQRLPYSIHLVMVQFRQALH